MCENNCGHGVWCTKHCPPKSNCQRSALQKDTNHECEAKLISLKTAICILNPCYDSWWNNFKGDFQKSHRFWFCCDDLNYCVGSSKKKYVIDGIMVWCVQEGTNLTQNVVIALEITFVLFEVIRWCLWNLFGNEKFNLMHKPLDLDVWPKIRNNKIIYTLLYSSSPRKMKIGGRLDTFSMQLFFHL